MLTVEHASICIRVWFAGLLTGGIIGAVCAALYLVGIP